MDKEIVKISELPVSILNIAAGRREPLFMPKVPHGSILVNIDKSYLESDNISSLMKDHEKLNNDPRSVNFPYPRIYNYKTDVFEFLSRYHFTFTMATTYRFLEHVPKDQALYFIYLVADILQPGGFFDIIVPDYEELSKRILSENPYDPDFEAEDIITTYELLNEPGDPHCSIWTTERLKKFLELEERFEVREIHRHYNYDGRNIYLRGIAKRL